MEIDFLQILIGFILGIIFTYLALKTRKANLKEPYLNPKLEKQNGVLTGELNAAKNQLKDLTQQRDQQTRQLQELISENSKLITANEILETQYKDSISVQGNLKKEFELIANKVLEKNTDHFNQTSQTSLKNILDPLKEKMNAFEKEINDKYIDEAKDKASLKTEITKLIELNNRLSDEANQLTKALKGNNKQQGNWGEVILEKVLERSGLEKGIEFTTQKAIKSEDGSTRIPDAIVFLPENKHIIIDSKVSLIAYERMVNSNTSEEKEAALKEHLISLKSHIKDLGSKRYYNSDELNSPEFTLLFIPIEASFSVALKEDNELFNYGWDKNIILVSPTTLLATLQTVASIWKHEKQTRHVLEIAKEGGALHDKFVAFVEDLQKIEKGIHQSQSAYSSAFNKLSSGKGNLVNRTNKLKILGAKANKALSSEIIEKSNYPDIENSPNE